jgi:chromate reductase
VQYRILAVSGSLRAASSNAMVLQAAALLAPPGVELVPYRGLGDLPHFNPDLDGDAPPPAVLALRREVDRAHGILISSPEYAHGVPGVLKNALDWLVRSVELVGKPVALLNASPLSSYADAALRETLTVMNTRLVAEASVTLPLYGRPSDPADVVADPDVAPVLREAVRRFVQALPLER